MSTGDYTFSVEVLDSVTLAKASYTLEVTVIDPCFADSQSSLNAFVLIHPYPVYIYLSGALKYSILISNLASGISGNLL